MQKLMMQNMQHNWKRFVFDVQHGGHIDSSQINNFQIIR